MQLFCVALFFLEILLYICLCFNTICLLYGHQGTSIFIGGEIKHLERFVEGCEIYQ